MRIKNRLYPYPVLGPSVGDYLRSTFKCVISPQISDAECKFIFDMVCTNKTILQMIENGKAMYAVHMECKYTYYRKLECSADARFRIILESDSVDRAVEICPVIIATEDIVGYTSNDLDDVYVGENIVIKSGNPIAIGEQATITITKEHDNLKKLSSPFCVLPYPDTMEQPAQKYASINFSDNDQLIIYLPEADYAILSRIQNSKNLDTIHAAMYFPSLIEALDYMKNDASEEDQEKRWYIALNSKAVDKGLGEIKGNRYSAFELAQVLFDYPLTRWLKGYIKDSGGSS